MRVLLTGGTGFIGTHLVSALLDAGDSVTALARDPNAMPEALAVRIAIVRGELDLDTVRAAARGHDAVIHNAVCWRDADDEIGLDDVRAAANVFRGASEAGAAQLVYTSSTAVHKPYVKRMDETVRLAPTDFYGAAKASNEAFLSAFSWTTPMRCNVIRPGPVVGGPAAVGARVVTYRLIDDIVRAARAGKDIHVTKHEGRQLVDVRDLARVYLAVLHSNANRQTWLAVARDVTEWEDVARKSVDLLGSPSRIVVEEAEPKDFTFDAGKLERDFGLSFTARKTLEADLRRLAHGVA